MRALCRVFSINTNTIGAQNLKSLLTVHQRAFSSQDDKQVPDWAASFGATPKSDLLGWDAAGASSWSTGLTKEHFDGEVVGQQISAETQSRTSGRSGGRDRDVGPYSDAKWTNDEMRKLKAYENAFRRGLRDVVDFSNDKTLETATLMKQIREPGARGSYLKDSEKAEMYKKHKENPEVYTVERLAKDYRIMRQRVHAILWLKEDEEKEEKKLGKPLDDLVELLIDTCPDFFISHDKEYHVATLPYKPDFKVMPEGWDGTTRDPDEVHYEISKKEDEMLYEEFVQKFNFNKMKWDKQVKCHKYSRRRPNEGWNFMVEKMGAKGKRGNGGGWKFMSEADGSTRPLNEFEKMFVKRETPRRRKKILP